MINRSEWRYMVSELEVGSWRTTLLSQDLLPYFTHFFDYECVFQSLSMIMEWHA